MKAAKLTKAEFLNVLRAIVECVESDDSFEGSLKYTCLEGDCKRGEFLVNAFWRNGNSQGQGGCAIISGPETIEA
jgi:hypothetical protein